MFSVINYNVPSSKTKIKNIAVWFSSGLLTRHTLRQDVFARKNRIFVNMNFVHVVFIVNPTNKRNIFEVSYQIIK